MDVAGQEGRSMSPGEKGAGWRLGRRALNVAWGEGRWISPGVKGAGCRRGRMALDVALHKSVSSLPVDFRHFGVVGQRGHNVRVGVSVGGHIVDEVTHLRRAEGGE